MLSNPAAASAGSNRRADVQEAAVESLVREFASNWKGGIKQINDNVLMYFANFRNGMEILKQVCFYVFCTDAFKTSLLRFRLCFSPS